MHEQWADRFWARVRKHEGSSACWVWIGSRLPRGYGLFYPKAGRGMYAHRVSWEIANGRPVPEGLHVMHACDNPWCVRPEHLSVGTRSDNMRDMWNKGRGHKNSKSGEEHYAHKLTEAQVIEMRERWARGGVKQRELAEQFGVTRALVGQIVRGVAWKHVPMSRTTPDAAHTEGQ